MVDKSVIKRNYFYIIYNILKDETAKDERHLSIKEICDIILEKYDLNIDKNTVSRIFNDLSFFGFDVNKDASGYYLDNRLFTDAEMGLLIDGIESISVLSADSKIEIYDKICKVVGKKVESIDCYLYNQDSHYVEDELLKIIDTVYTAIGQNKCLSLFDPFCFKQTLIDELSEEESEYLKELMVDSNLFFINPYQIFRSKENEIFLLFYYKLPTRFVTGTLNLSNVEPEWLTISDNTRDEIDIKLLLSKDLTDFTSPEDYIANEYILTAEIVPLKQNDDKTMYFEFLLEECEAYDVVEKDNTKIYNIKYKYKNENNIVSFCIECYEYLKVLSGSRLYDELKRIYNSLKNNYS